MQRVFASNIMFRKKIKKMGQIHRFLSIYFWGTTKTMRLCRIKNEVQVDKNANNGTETEIFGHNISGATYNCTL